VISETVSAEPFNKEAALVAVYVEFDEQEAIEGKQRDLHKWARLGQTRMRRRSIISHPTAQGLRA
jgi:hypothetical protein